METVGLIPRTANKEWRHIKGVDNVGARGASAPPHFFGRTYVVLVKVIVEWTNFQCHVLVNGQKHNVFKFKVLIRCNSFNNKYGRLSSVGLV